MATSPAPHAGDTAAPGTSTALNTFRWLVILGFPVSVAAALAMPDLFTTDAPRRPRR